MTGRHRAPARIWPTATAAALLGAAGLVGALDTTTSPPVPASVSTALPTEDRDMLTARGADIAPGPLALPTIVPTDAPVWEPAKGPVIVNRQPLRTTTRTSPAVTATTTAGATTPAAETTEPTPTPAAGATSAPGETAAAETTAPTETPTPTGDPTIPPPVDITATTTSAEPTP